MVGKNKLIRQMGNARFFITRSCSTFKYYRLMGKLMGLENDYVFEEKKFVKVEVSHDGTKRWCLGENFHRISGPAIEYEDE